jgi:hypothetical protein
MVENVKNGVFRARLVRLDEGDRPTKIEYSDFSLDDLADQGDRTLVEPGAIFYWTIARRWNSAGTMTNESLVRFRRVSSSRSHAEAASKEADELFEALRDTK